MKRIRPDEVGVGTKPPSSNAKTNAAMRRTLWVCEASFARPVGTSSLPAPRVVIYSFAFVAGRQSSTRATDHLVTSMGNEALPLSIARLALTPPGSTLPRIGTSTLASSANTGGCSRLQLRRQPVQRTEPCLISSATRLDPYECLVKSFHQACCSSIGTNLGQPRLKFALNDHSCARRKIRIIPYFSTA